MRRVLIGAALLGGGCEEYDYGPRIFPVAVEHDADPNCYQSEKQLEDGIYPGPCRVLLLDPYEVGAGEEFLLRVEFAFEDPDGDLEDVRLAVGLPEESIVRTFSANAWDDVTSGIISVEQPFNFPEPGARYVDVWVVDRSGHVSNQLRNVLYVLDPNTSEG